MISERIGLLRAAGAKASPRWPTGIIARRTQVTLALCALVMLALLGWTTWSQIHGRMALERAVAAQVTSAAAARLQQRLQQDRLQLADFVADNRDLLAALIAAPDEEILRDQLWSNLEVGFHDLTAAVLVGAQDVRGLTLAGLVPTESWRQLRALVRGSGRTLRLTEDAGRIHAEVVATWGLEDKTGGALLIRLACEELLDLIKEGPIPRGHQPTLRPRGDLEDGVLVLAAVPVGDTGWEVQDRLEPAYAAELRRRPLALGAGLGLTLLLGLASLAAWVRWQDPASRRAARALEAADARLQAVLAATTDGILLTDLDGRIELLNPAAEVMFGRLAEDVVTTPVERLIPDFLASDGESDTPGAGEDEASLPVVRETRGVRRGGEEFPLRLWLRRTQIGDRPQMLGVVQDLTEHERNEEQLAYLAQRDVLTGLWNRRELERQLAALLAEGPEGRPGPHALCHLDVDQFKLINEGCGHEAGDALLKQLATLLTAKLDGRQVVARIAGDEFALLLPDRHIDSALALCDGLLQTIRSFVFTWRDRSFDVSASIGVVELRPETETPSSALSKADVACQMAKGRGRDRVHVYQASDAELARHHGDMRLVTTISAALKEGRFQLFAQPILPLAAGAGERLHFEVLVRMRDADGRPVIPDSFIPAAERYILMPTIDRWVIHRLFQLQAERLRAWFGQAPNQFLFAVNLSGTSLADEGFLRYLKRQFSDFDIPYPSICFEITETAAVRDLKGARAFMEELAVLGCRFALDDFGAGASSYRYLKSLPVDYIKIDGSFVRGMASDPVDYALVESINQIGHVLHLKTIAEWVEDRNTLSQLRALNVDYAQGYGVGEAIPVEALTLEQTQIPTDLRGLSHDRHRGADLPRRAPARST